MKKVIIIIAFFLVFFGCKTNTSVTGREIPFLDTGVNPNEWVLIKSGEFFKGLHDHKTMVKKDYEIMITHVTNDQYVYYLNEALKKGTIKIEDGMIKGFYPGDKFHEYKHEKQIGKGFWPHMPVYKPGQRIKFDGKIFSSIRGFENHPVTMVSWFGAKAFCDFYGWRLPTENEWEKAARGCDKRAYPWGNDISRGHANYYSSRLKVMKALNIHTYTTSPVGFFTGQTHNGFETKNGKTPEGLHDMAGNVWQWTADIYKDMHYRFMRGGSFTNYAYNLRIWVKNSAGPEFYDINIGFRCVRDIKNEEASGDSNSGEKIIDEN